MFVNALEGDIHIGLAGAINVCGVEFLVLTPATAAALVRFGPHQISVRQAREQGAVEDNGRNTRTACAKALVPPGRDQDPVHITIRVAIAQIEPRSSGPGLIGHGPANGQRARTTGILGEAVKIFEIEWRRQINVLIIHDRKGPSIGFLARDAVLPYQRERMERDGIQDASDGRGDVVGRRGGCNARSEGGAVEQKLYRA